MYSPGFNVVLLQKYSFILASKEKKKKKITVRTETDAVEGYNRNGDGRGDRRIYLSLLLLLFIACLGGSGRVEKRGGQTMYETKTAATTGVRG